MVAGGKVYPSGDSLDMTNNPQQEAEELRGSTAKQETEIVIASTQLAKISDINIGQRFRKDLGNIDDLVASIRKALLYPVLVRKDNLLIDGARRIEACKKLNIQDIPVLVKDAVIKEDAEIDANLVRKDFTIEEIVDIKRYRESKEPNLQGQRNDLKLLGNFPGSDNKERRERIAESTGVSYKTLQKMEEIVDAAQKHPDQFGHLIRKINTGKTNVSKALNLIQRENKIQEILEKARGEVKYNNDNLKLFHGDFRDVCKKHMLIISYYGN